MSTREAGYVSYRQLFVYLGSLVTILFGVLYAAIILHGHAPMPHNHDGAATQEEMRQVHQDVREIRQFLMEKMTKSSTDSGSPFGPR